jgi:hypothetical protein
VDPGVGAKAQGLVPGNPFFGAWFNWLLNVVARHIAYLRTLHTDSFFLGQTYAWTAAHSFTSALTTVVNLVATGVLHTVGGLQLRGTSEVKYTDAAGAPSPRSRTKLVKLQQYVRAVSTAGADSYGLRAGGLITQKDNDQIDIVLELPQDAVLTGARLGWYTTTGGLASAELYRVTPNKGSAGTVTEVQIGLSPVGLNTTGTFTMPLSSGLVIPQSNAVHFNIVRIISSALSSTGDEGPAFFEYTFDDYGPINA